MNFISSLVADFKNDWSNFFKSTGFNVIGGITNQQLNRLFDFIDEKTNPQSDRFAMDWNQPSLPPSVVAESDRFGETNDCSVKCLAIVTGKSYAQCHEALRLQGRKKGRGANGRQIEKALNALGFKTVNTEWTGKTFISFKCDPEKVVMLFSKSHVVAVTNSVIRDWSNGTRRKPIGAWEIVRMDSQS